MKITFLMPALNLTGGARVVSIYAQLLSERGHQVTVISPNKKKPTFKDKVKSAIKWKGYSFTTNFNTTFFDKHDYELKILKEHRNIENDDVPDADIIIATFWNTAEWISGFNEDKGTKTYFLQHYEMHPWLPNDRVAATLRLPFHQIVVSQWIADILITKYQKKQVDLVGNAVDLNHFSRTERTKNIRPTFGFMYSRRAYKGSQQAINAFERLKLLFPNIRILAFGLENEEEATNLLRGTSYYCRPEQSQIPKIYNQCDAWLFVSSIEGYGLPILEAMACGTPVIGTSCGAAPELINSDNGFLIDIDDQDALLDAMVKVCELNDADWQDMSFSASREASKHTWNSSADKFEQSLARALGND